MTSFHSLPSLRDILNPPEDRVGSSPNPRTSIAPTSANRTSQVSERSPFAEQKERHQPQLYHNHSVPGPPNFEPPPSASPNRYTKYGPVGNEDPLSHIALSTTRNTLVSSDYDGRHQTSASPQHLTPHSTTSDHVVYAVHDRVYQPEPYYSRLNIEPRSLDHGPFPGEDRYWTFPGSPDGRKYAPGDCVNPQWGITKAGKPRKRLGKSEMCGSILKINSFFLTFASVLTAQACTTCREKKIKCDPMVKNDPGSPKCAQCQKFGRECRFENG